MEECEEGSNLPRFIEGIHVPSRPGYLPWRGVVAVWRGLWLCHITWDGTVPLNRSTRVNLCVHPLEDTSQFIEGGRHKS